MSDPFGNYAANSDVVFENTVSTTDTKENKTVTETNNTKAMTITLKGGTGFDSPWIVLYADNAEEGLSLMQDAKLAELMDVVKRAGAHFGSLHNAAPAPQAQTPSGQPVASQQASGGDGRSCQHGVMKFKQGMSKAGKAYTAYFCPTPQGTPDQCKPTFIN